MGKWGEITYTYTGYNPMYNWKELNVVLMEKSFI